jgi:hypothetical protein
MAQMNRSYGSDIQNLLDVALRYKTAKDVKDYREAALLAEKGYREQRAKQELGLAMLKYLADKDIESINEYNRVQKIYDEMKLDKSRIESKLKENISPDTEETYSTAGDNLESIQARMIEDIAERNEKINILNQEIVRGNELENQYPKIYNAIMEAGKNQGLQGQYDVKFEEFLDAIAKNPYMYGGKPVELSDYEKNKAYSYMEERANQEYSELAKNIVGVPTESGIKYMPRSELIEETVPMQAEVQRLTDMIHTAEFHAKNLAYLMNKYIKSGQTQEDFDNIIGDYIAVNSEDFKMLNGIIDPQTAINFIMKFGGGEVKSSGDIEVINPKQSKIDISKYKR